MKLDRRPNRGLFFARGLLRVNIFSRWECWAEWAVINWMFLQGPQHLQTSAPVPVWAPLTTDIFFNFFLKEWNLSKLYAQPNFYRTISWNRRSLKYCSREKRQTYLIPSSGQKKTPLQTTKCNVKMKIINHRQLVLMRSITPIRAKRVQFRPLWKNNFQSRFKSPKQNKYWRILV